MWLLPTPVCPSSKAFSRRSTKAQVAKSSTFAFGTCGLKWKSKTSSVFWCSKLARRTRWSSCFASRRSTSSLTRRYRNSSYPRLSSAASRSLSSRDCSTPLRRSFFSNGTSSSMTLMAHLRFGPGARGAREARSLCPKRLLHRLGQRLEVERLRKDGLDGSIADVPVEARTAAGRLCSLEGKFFEMRDDGLDLPQLAQHVVPVEELAHQLHHV